MGREAALKPNALVYQTQRMHWFAAGSRQIVGKPTPTAFGQNQKRSICTLSNHGYVTRPRKPRVLPMPQSVATVLVRLRRELTLSHPNGKRWPLDIFLNFIFDTNRHT
jgi:hypothetical protein